MARNNSASSQHALADCQHSKLTYAPSSFAEEIYYRRPAAQQRATAAGLKKDEEFPDECFPGPLVLPGDDLAWDPRCPPQSVRSWAREPDRNKVTSMRNVLYVADYPRIPPSMRFIKGSDRLENASKVAPLAEDIIEYLAAFYHGLVVKLLPRKLLAFARWDGSDSKTPSAIALNTPEESIRIGLRPSPDQMFSRQLNLNDVLDVAISVLPDDAYALLLLVEQDLYEDEEDDFCCGRAYGGSRVAVVSTARYNPSIDHHQNIERSHSWPASHCEAYVKSCCAQFTQPIKKSRQKRAKTAVIDLTLSSPPHVNSRPDSTSPLQAAVDASYGLLATGESTSSLWFTRVCRTAAHELGHCLGLDHCVYYACMMQGTASMIEDCRQPPYLCPVDMAKVNKATGSGEWERLKALSGFCERHQHTALFAGFKAWVQKRLAILENE